MSKSCYSLEKQRKRILFKVLYSSKRNGVDTTPHKRGQLEHYMKEFTSSIFVPETSQYDRLDTRITTHQKMLKIILNEFQ